MVTSFIVLIITLNTAYVSSGNELVEVCIVSANNSTYDPVAGACKDVASDAVKQLTREYPSRPVEVILNGVNLNKV